jgi:hypothetical protein
VKRAKTDPHTLKPGEIVLSSYLPGQLFTIAHITYDDGCASGLRVTVYEKPPCPTCGQRPRLKIPKGGIDAGYFRRAGERPEWSPPHVPESNPEGA